MQSIKRGPKTNIAVMRPKGERYFTVRFRNELGSPYFWSSKNHTLIGPGTVRPKTRFSNIFRRPGRKQIKSVIIRPPPSKRDFVSPNNIPNVRRRRQQGGTCWFHALINGLIMSSACRKVLLKHLEQFNNSNMGLRRLFNGNGENVCLSRSAGPSLFWRYIRHRLEKSGRVNTVYRNANVIRNIGLRSRGWTRAIPRPFSKTPYLRRVASAWPIVHGGGLMPDILNLYSKLFPGDFKVGFKGTSTPTFIISKTDTRFHEYVKHNDALYRLSHAVIMFSPMIPVTGHMIAGYVTRTGKYNVYDSGKDSVYTDAAWDSSVHDKDLLRIMNEGYPIKFTKMYKRAFYVRVT